MRGLHIPPQYDPAFSLKVTIVWTTTEVSSLMGIGTVVSKTKKTVRIYKPLPNSPPLSQVMGEIELWNTKGHAWIDDQMVTYSQIQSIHIEQRL